MGQTFIKPTQMDDAQPINPEQTQNYGMSTFMPIESTGNQSSYGTLMTSYPMPLESTEPPL